MMEILWSIFGIGLWSSGLEEISPPLTELRVSADETPWEYSPILSAQAALVMEIESASIVYEKNADQPLPMASLTKIMTALLIVEDLDLLNIYKIPQVAAQTNGSSMQLITGEVLRIQDLLRGLLINSGNDAAIALAIAHSEGIVEFVNQMNIRAHELFLENTKFQNPHGLDAPDHFSSARDIAKLSKILLQHPKIREIVKTKSIQITSLDTSEITHNLHNTNQLLGTIFPVFGLKTGTTENAGQCIVALIQENQKEYIIVIMGSQDRYKDIKALMYPIISNKINPSINWSNTQ